MGMDESYRDSGDYFFSNIHLLTKRNPRIDVKSVIIAQIAPFYVSMRKIRSERNLQCHH